mmetsp:Transcript_11777/g.21355  ORF Transcript_11777/g.21355 Transcript_11777/m.21355 type:complete len:94 (-) Transcript_11777:1054-1335(-)
MIKPYYRHSLIAVMKPYYGHSLTAERGVWHRHPGTSSIHLCPAVIPQPPVLALLTPDSVTTPSAKLLRPPPAWAWYCREVAPTQGTAEHPTGG